MTFGFRGIEVHSKYAWDMDLVTRALRFARDHEMTALVIHRNDIVDRVVYPTKYYGGTGKYKNIIERYQDIHRSLYELTPTRRSGSYQRRDYLKRIIDLAARWNIEVYFENKELFYHDILIEFVPHLVKNGCVCPSEPFWWEFLEVKYTELFQELPGLAGVICAPGTGESRTAISSSRCTCELCQSTNLASWYTDLLNAMHKPIRAAGKTFVVRDFVHHRAVHDQLGKAFAELPEDIVVSLKNTPHDYFPTFPDNPRLGKVGKRRQWLEFDCMGQYFGWGLSPAIMIEDMRGRLSRGAAAGVDGAIFRTDWESLDGHSAFFTPNLINVYAGAALTCDLEAEALPLYEAWLTEEGFVRDNATPQDRREAALWAERLFGGSWDITRLASYARDYVMNDSTTYPVSYKIAWWLTEEKLSLVEWDPERAGRLDPTEQNTRLVLEEKEEAVRRVEALAPLLDAPPAALTDTAIAHFRQHYDVFRRFVVGFRLVASALMLARYVSEGPQSPSPFRKQAENRLARTMNELLNLADSFDDFAAATEHNYPVYILLSAERVRALHRDLSEHLAGLPGARPLEVEEARP